MEVSRGFIVERINERRQYAEYNANIRLEELY